VRLKRILFVLIAIVLLALVTLGGRTALLFALFLLLLLALAFFMAKPAVQRAASSIAVGSKGKPPESAGGVRFSRCILPNRLMVGDTATVELTLENTGRLPVPWMEVWDDLPPYLVPAGGSTRNALSLMPKERRLLRYQVRFNKRGDFNLKPLLVANGDPWGLWRQERREPAPASALVFPRILPLEEVKLPLRKPFEGQKSGFHAYEDTTSVSGIRAYEPHDPMKRIHWKLSAHLGQLMVKEFEFTANTAITLWLDLTVGRLNRGFLEVYEDFAAMIAASILRYAEEKHIPTALVSFPSKRPSVTLGSGKDHFLRQMEELARAQLGEGELLAGMPEAARQLPWQSNLILISSLLPRELVMRLAELHRRTQHLTVYLLYEGSFLLPGEKPRQSWLLDPQEVVELRRCSALLEAQGVRVRLVGGNDPLSVVI